MNEEQQTFIQGIDHASQNAVIVKVTGREGLDLTPHSHNRVQLVEAVAGTLRVTVGNHEYFVPEGYACWIPAGMKHALTSHNHRIALRIFYFMCDGDIDTAESFSVHYVCPWAEANFRFIADYGPSISADTDGLYNFLSLLFPHFPQGGAAVSAATARHQRRHSSNSKKGNGLYPHPSCRRHHVRGCGRCGRHLTALAEPSVQ